MTSFQTIYDAFLPKMLEDEWVHWDEIDVNKDLYALLLGALPQFKFPRSSLEYTSSGFLGDLSNSEIQILATYMKCEWLNRTILTWENVKPLYDERDFSQANLIDKFKALLEREEKKAEKLEAKYYRSRDKKPFDFTKLAGS